MSSPPTDPFSAYGEAMTTVGIWIQKHPIAFMVLALLLGVVVGALAYLVG